MEMALLSINLFVLLLLFLRSLLEAFSLPLLGAKAQKKTW